MGCNPGNALVLSLLSSQDFRMQPIDPFDCLRLWDRPGSMKLDLGTLDPVTFLDLVHATLIE